MWSFSFFCSKNVVWILFHISATPCLYKFMNFTVSRFIFSMLFHYQWKFSCEILGSECTIRSQKTTLYSLFFEIKGEFPPPRQVKVTGIGKVQKLFYQDKGFSKFLLAKPFRGNPKQINNNKFYSFFQKMIIYITLSVFGEEFKVFSVFL